MAGEKKLDMKVLATQDKLTDENMAAIQAEVLAEEGIKPVEEKKEKEVVEQEPDVEKIEEEKKAAAEAKKKEEDEAAAQETEEIKKEEERLINAKEEDLSDEEKTKRADLINARDEAKQQKETEEKKLKEDLDKEVKAYATEHKISEEEAHTDFESREKILEKYKSDPKQLALANLHLQRLYTRTQEELKTVKDAKPSQAAREIPLEAVVKLIDDGKIQLNGKAATREGLIDAYRKMNPDVTENLEDEAVIKMVAKELKENYIRSKEEQVQTISAEAKKKRTTLLEALPEADKKFLPEIQPLLDKMPDAAVMAEDYNVDALIFWAKGKTYDVDLKAFGEKEYKRGLEQAKIIAQKESPSSGGHQKVKVKSKVTLTEEQKQRALSMYEGTTFTDEEKFANYAEVMEIDNKDKK